VANDNDTAANITFVNCAFNDNVYSTFGCDVLTSHAWCYYMGPPGAAGLSTVSDVVFKGRTVFKNNTWGALYVSSPVNISFLGKVDVVDNSKRPGNWQPFKKRQGPPTAAAGVGPLSEGTVRPADVSGPVCGAGLYASGGAHLTFAGTATFR
jgi:hypothetical protein